METGKDYVYDQKQVDELLGGCDNGQQKGCNNV